MSKDSELYQRAAKTARQLGSSDATKVIRALLSACNRKDRELSEWRSGRMAEALKKENESLVSANAYLQEMLRQQSERKSA